MTVMTGPSTSTRRSHLRLVQPDERATHDEWTVAVASDPAPGPRSAAELVAQFAALMPAGQDPTGTFSLGAS